MKTYTCLISMACILIGCGIENTNKVSPAEAEELNKEAFEQLNAAQANQNVNGPIEFYYENGQKLSSGTFENGKRVGEHTEWHENGRIAQKGVFKEGKREGLWIDYDEDGSEKKRTVYKGGKPIDG